MTRSLLLLLPFAIMGCPSSEKPDDTAGGDDSGGGGAACEIEVDETIPADGAVDAYYRGNIEFYLEDPDPTAQIVTDIPGTQTTNDDGDVIIWEIDQTQPLAPNTTYTATLEYCGGSPSISFTTSALGTPITDESSLIGRTYLLDLAHSRIVEPEGIGSVLTSYLTQDVLVGVDSIGGGQIQMIGAIGSEETATPTQDYCTTTIPFPSADFAASPYFEIGPEDLVLSVSDYDVAIQGLEISGTFAADASYFGGGTLAGTIDTRPIAIGLFDGDEGAVCEMAVSFNAACEACPEDGQPYCLSLVAVDITATEVSGVTLKEIAGSDCDGCTSWTQDTVPAPESQVCPTE